jgi:hypothetical protein
VTTYQGGQDNRNEKMIAVFFAMFSTSVRISWFYFNLIGSASHGPLNEHTMLYNIM